MFFAKVNVDEAPKLQKIWNRYNSNASSFKNGEVAGTIVAPDSKAKIETFIQEYL